MPQPTQIRLPLQPPIFRKEHFASDEGIRYVNQQMLQMAIAINSARGEFGPATIPGGVDVQGASITGLAAPSGPTDAVSAGHAAGNYGAPAVGPQLDIGGPNTLKGLAYVYGQVQANGPEITALQNALAAGVSGTITLAKLTTGGTEGSITVIGGIITGFVQAT